MCGRFTLQTNPALYAEVLEVARDLRGDTWTPRYNVCPTQTVVCVRQADVREFFTPRWGLIPGWAKDARIGAQCINARSDTVDSRPAFRAAFKKRRCLVLADGFYEWRKPDRQPFYISLRSGEPLLFAGLWETWESPEGPLESCTICTTDANDLMSLLHDRMPVILPRKAIDLWLDPASALPEVKQLLQPCESQTLQAWAVGKAVGNVRNQGASLIEPLTPTP